jgi:peptidase E
VIASSRSAPTAAKVTSGISYIGSVAGCLLGTPISSTTGLIDSLVLTQ